MGDREQNNEVRYMFSSSLEVAYLSSVVMFISLPAEMGMSASPVVLPVRISGPFYTVSAVESCQRGIGPRTVSRAMARGRPFCPFSASLA